MEGFGKNKEKREYTNLGSNLLIIIFRITLIFRVKLEITL